MKLGASYFGNRTLKHVRTDMEKMVDDGCNQVVHTMSEHDILYHSQTMVDIVKVSREDDEARCKGRSQYRGAMRQDVRVRASIWIVMM